MTSHNYAGILNIFNPCKPEGGWQLDLMRWEERQVAKMLIHLSVVEPGDNCECMRTATMCIY